MRILGRGDGRPMGDPVMAKRNLYATMVELGLPADLLPGQFRGVEVKINGRLRRSIGITRWRGHRRLGLTTTVELQPWVLASPLAREVVAHEAAHVVAGIDAHHDYNWRGWCLKLGGTGDVRLSHDRVAAYVATTHKPIAVCSRCRTEIMGTRRLRQDSLYTHKGCGGTAVPVEG